MPNAADHDRQEGFLQIEMESGDEMLTWRWTRSSYVPRTGEVDGCMEVDSFADERGW